jgi:uncharacterized membrane protein YeaQ/YmgE (transglycosylase-associated protein family)
MSWIVIGLVAGILAKILMPGDAPGGIILTIVTGMVGAIVGGLVVGLLGGTGVTGLNIWSILVATLGGRHPDNLLQACSQAAYVGRRAAHTVPLDQLLPCIPKGLFTERRGRGVLEVCGVRAGERATAVESPAGVLVERLPAALRLACPRLA